MNKTYHDFLKNEVPTLLEKLTPETEAKFGLMTPQHMVEHLTVSAKSILKRHGEPEAPPTKGQLGSSNL